MVLPMPRQVAIVPHTHWDREWYRPFQTFRLRLVDVLDGLLPRLADGSAGDHFMLDGQMAAEYLPVGYRNRPAVPGSAPGLLPRIRAHEAELGSALLDGMLVMNGSDHATPQPWLVRVVSDANTAQQDYSLRITSLLEYLDAAPTEGLPTWTGELRSGARANLLMGVLSNRVDVKQAAARAERELERLAEPLSALFLPV